MPNADRYLRIENFRRYQHYKERRPPWVKQHRDFWNDYDMSTQKTSTRLLALFLIAYASEFENELIPYNVSEISRRSCLNRVAVEFGIENLVKASFLAITTRKGASVALAKRKQNAKPLVQRTEEEIEKDKEVREVFDYWVEARGKNPERTKLTDGRRRVISARLKDFSVEDAKRAIDGVGRDDWDKRAKHDDLTIIFRPEKFEQWLALSDDPAAMSTEERRERHLQALKERGVA